ncbi:MAG: hypothetical protein WC517_03410 [Patescibacteria group bacterium]
MNNELRKLASTCEKVLIMQKIGVALRLKYPGMFKQKIPSAVGFDINNIKPATKPLRPEINKVNTSTKPSSLWDKYTDSWNKNPMATGAATVGGLMVGDRILR